MNSIKFWLVEFFSSYGFVGLRTYVWYYNAVLRLIARITSSVQAFFIIIICVFLRYKVLYFVKKLGCYRCLKDPQNLKGLTVNFVQGLFNQCFHLQIFCFFVERNLIDSSYILWNKFQDYQPILILANHFLVTA